MNYLAKHINEGRVESVANERVEFELERAQFFPISQYPNGVNLLAKEIGCYYNPDYSAQCIRIAIE